MKKKILWITESAVMLALLVTLQTITKPAGQLVTGSCVNACLAIAVLVGGLSCGLTVAFFSPMVAFFLGIAPQILTVPAIVVGNMVYVTILYLLSDRSGKKMTKQMTAWILAAFLKFAVLYLIVIKLVCGVFAEGLLVKGMLKEPMLKALPTTFSYPQLITAMVGGAVALFIAPILIRALHADRVIE